MGANAEGVEPPRGLELIAKLVGERPVDATGQHVEDRAERHEPAYFEAVAVVHEQLLHELERGALPLQRAGDVDHGMHERGTERVGELEGLPVALLAVRVEQDLPGLLGDVGGFGEGLVEQSAGVVVLGLKQPLVRDLGKVVVIEAD